MPMSARDLFCFGDEGEADFEVLMGFDTGTAAGDGEDDVDVVEGEDGRFIALERTRTATTTGTMTAMATKSSTKATVTATSTTSVVGKGG